MTTLDGDSILARPVAEHTAEQAAAALTRSFEGYVVPIKMTPQSFERRFVGESLDPFASRVYYRGEDIAGIVLVARRGWTSRIAAMGVAPDLRGQGLGRRRPAEAGEGGRGRGRRGGGGGGPAADRRGGGGQEPRRPGGAAGGHRAEHAGRAALHERRIPSAPPALRLPPGRGRHDGGLSR